MKMRFPALLLSLALISAPLEGRADTFSCLEFLLQVRNSLIGPSGPKPRISPHRVAAPLLDLIDAKGLNDPEVIRLFVRRSYRPVEQHNYIRNSADALREVFAPWFERLEGDAFQDMLKLHHATIVRGLDRKYSYRSTSTEHPIGGRAIGRLRYEALRSHHGAFFDFVLTADQLEGMQFPAFLNWLKEPRPVKVFPLELEGIPPAHRPDARWTLAFSPEEGWLGRYKVSYPEDGFTRTYVNRMALIMEEVRSLPVRGAAARGQEQDRLLRLLADYVQLFVVGLPFDRVNYSIAMAQANYVLMKHGLRGIEHQELDYIALMTPTRVFREVFAEAVRLGN